MDAKELDGLLSGVPVEIARSAWGKDAITFLQSFYRLLAATEGSTDEIDKRQVIKQAAIDAGFAFDPRDGNFYGEEGWIGGKLLKMGELLFSRLETEFTARIVAQDGRIKELNEKLVSINRLYDCGGAAFKELDSLLNQVIDAQDSIAKLEAERDRLKAHAEAMASELLDLRDGRLIGTQAVVVDQYRRDFLKDTP